MNRLSLRTARIILHSDMMPITCYYCIFIENNTDSSLLNFASTDLLINIILLIFMNTRQRGIGWRTQVTITESAVAADHRRLGVGCNYYYLSFSLLQPPNPSTNSYVVPVFQSLLYMKVSASNFVCQFLYAQWTPGNNCWRFVKNCVSPFFIATVLLYTVGVIIPN